MTHSISVPDDFKTWLDIEIVSRLRDFDHPKDMLGHGFAHVCLELILGLDSEEIFDLMENLRSSDHGLDCIYFDDDNAIVRMFQSKWAETYKVFDRAPGGDLINAWAQLKSKDSCLKIGGKWPEYHQRLKLALENDYKISFELVLHGSLSESAENDFLESVDQLGGSNTEFDIHDFEHLYKQYVILYGDQLVTDTISVMTDGILDCSHLEPPAYIANIELQKFGESIKPYIPEIFNVNVRRSLNKNKVNNGIKETLIGSNENDKGGNFWHFNNGITILCKDCNANENHLSISNPQIVNGCQTASQITNNIFSLKYPKTHILAKIIVVSSFDDPIAIDIAKYTNSQSPVLSSDLVSNDPIQIELQVGFNSMDPKWFYERKRGEWDSLSRRKKHDYQIARNKHRRIPMTSGAQLFYAFNNSPSIAISQKTKLFENKGIYNSIFPKGDRTPHEILLPYLLFLQIGDKISEKIEMATMKLNQHGELGLGPIEKAFLKIKNAKTLVGAHILRLIKLILDSTGASCNHEFYLRTLKAVNNKSIIDSLFPRISELITEYTLSIPEDESLHQHLKHNDAMDDLYNKYLIKLSTWETNDDGGPNEVIKKLIT